ncbi:MAG: hypothetical protein PSN34_06460 [Urechidicola sp.]|nr:hypothetical protein [Urechidicola sp.]
MKTENIEVEYKEISNNHKNQKQMSETLKNKDLSIEELEVILAQKKLRQRKKRESEQQAYVKDRDDNIDCIIEESIHLNKQVKLFKEKVARVMVLQSEKLAGYGKIRKNSKGGFSITNTEGNQRIIRRRDTEPTWDERGDKGVAMLKEFLADVVKKRDVKNV